MVEEKDKEEKTEKKSKFNIFKDFPSKKPYIEFFTAVLTVPVLITVILLNVDKISGEDDTPTDTKDDGKQTVVITQPPGENVKEKEVVVTKEACEPGIGEVSISSPVEDENTSKNPVFVDIDYDANGYCNIVWSYRVNGEEWSSFDDRSIALYNLETGEVKLDLRVKSVVNSDQETFSRTFVYSGNSSNTTPTSTLTPTPSE